MTADLRIGIAGLGTVGAGVLKLLAEHRDLLRQRCGRGLAVVAVSARDRNRERAVAWAPARWVDDPVALAAAPDIDVVVELIGGSAGAPRALVEQAIAAGKSVVTANKALIAAAGTQLARAAERAGVSLLFEAAVAGGIPILKAVRESLAGNRLTRVYGILNGTCNYILTNMQETGRPFAEILEEAQALGYAEADPSFDVDGIDAAHKLAILTSLAFGCAVNLDAVYVEGIRDISPADIAYARELGFRIKLLAIARRDGAAIEQRVHPCMVPLDTPIAHVGGVFNAVVTEGDYVGRAVFEGRGAGAGPTASAVVADLVDIARGLEVPAFAVPAAELEAAAVAPMAAHRGPYYVRLLVVDKPGVMADIAAILRDERVSIESVLQRGRSPNEPVPLVLTTHDTEERQMKAALAKIARLDSVIESPHLIRIEHL
ncbi:MAG: homoserine dehydrogenase [Alphaproteobacteria bacterium]|nr:homoserine dehydrogenase [Alphaproteobacteria bacterium]